MVYTLTNNKELVEEMGNILVGWASCRLPAQQGWHAFNNGQIFARCQSRLRSISMTVSTSWSRGKYKCLRRIAVTLLFCLLPSQRTLSDVGT